MNCILCLTLNVFVAESLAAIKTALTEKICLASVNMSVYEPKLNPRESLVSVRLSHVRIASSVPLVIIPVK